MEVFNSCYTPAKLEITFDKDLRLVNFSRCCYLNPFIENMDLSDFLNIQDIISFAEEQSMKVPATRKDSYKEWCVQNCTVENKIRVVSIAMSKACNLNCYHCFFTEHVDSAESRDLQFETLEKIKGHNLDRICILGSGEVFFYYDRLIKFLKSLSVADTKVVDLQTNLTLLNEIRIKELKQISDDTGVKYLFSPSVDGISKRSYESIRKGAKFNQVIENVKLLRDTFGAENIYINFTLKKPAFKELSKVRPFFKKLGITNVQISHDIYDEKAKKLLSNYKES